MLPEVIKIPTDIKERLEKFVKKAQANCTENLVSIYLFGGTAKEEFEINHSDINVLIILKKTDILGLDALNIALERPIYKIALNPFIISEDELESAANLFPVKFLDIKKNNIKLQGKELLTTLQINEDLLKRNSRRELKNMAFRLNGIYIHNHASEEILGDRLKKMIPSLLIHLNILCYLKSGQLLRTKEDIIEKASNLFALDGKLLSQLYLYKKGEKEILNKELKEWYSHFMTIVKEISTKADSL